MFSPCRAGSKGRFLRLHLFMWKDVVEIMPSKEPSLELWILPGKHALLLGVIPWAIGEEGGYASNLKNTFLCSQNEACLFCPL